MWRTEDWDNFVDVKPEKEFEEHFLGDECWCDPDIDESGKRIIFLHRNRKQPNKIKGGNVKIKMQVVYDIPKEDLEHVIDQHLPIEELSQKAELLQKGKTTFNEDGPHEGHKVNVRIEVQDAKKTN